MMKEREYITDADTSVMCFNSCDWTSLYIHAGISTLFIATQLGSAVAAFWVIRTVGRMASLSSGARRLHVQLTRLLLLQVTFVGLSKLSFTCSSCYHSRKFYGISCFESNHKCASILRERLFRSKTKEERCPSVKAS